MKDSTSNIKTPKMFKRGQGENYSFRYNDDGENKWKSTGECELTKAKAFARKFLAKIVKGETPSKDFTSPLQSLQDTWESKYQKYKDLSSGSKKYAKTVFNTFR